MATDVLSAEETRVADLTDQLIAQNPPASTSAIAFLGAQFDLGLAWVHFPVGHGGLDLSPKFQKIVNEKIARAGGPNSYARNPIGYGMCGPTVVEWGTDEQKRRYLRPLFTGEEIWCQLFSEPASGSDLAALRTKAEKDGDDWVINGQKIWTSGAHYSDYGMIVTRTDPTVAKHKGLTAFLVDMKAVGVETKPIKQLTGDADFNEVYFTDVRIPDSYRLGEVGQGWQVALTTLMNERASIGSADSGENTMYTRLLEMIRHYELDTDPIVREMLADLYINTKVAGYTSQRATDKMRAGQLPGPEMSIGKMALVNNQKKMNDLVAHVLGAKLVVDTGEWGTYAWSQLLLGAPGMRIAGGSDEVMRNIVGERVLGLPKDVGIDSKSPFRDIKVGTQKD